MLSVLPEPMWHLVQGFVFDAGPNIAAFMREAVAGAAADYERARRLK